MAAGLLGDAEAGSSRMGDVSGGVGKDCSLRCDIFGDGEGEGEGVGVSCGDCRPQLSSGVLLYGTPFEGRFRVASCLPLILQLR